MNCLVVKVVKLPYCSAIERTQLVIFYIYFLVKKSLEKILTNNDLILLRIRIGPYKIESGIYL